MNLFEKQNKPFAIKLSDRVKEEIEKTFNTNWYSIEQADALFHYPNLNNQKGFEISFHSRVELEPNYTLITEAEFFGDGNNKLREKMQMYIDIYKEEHLVDTLEQITDDAMIKFIIWVGRNYNKSKEVYYHKGNFEKTKKHKVTITELLQIFKTKHYE